MDEAEGVAPVDPVGHPLPLGGAVGEELWGGSEALSVSVWGEVTNHMHWGRFLERVASAGWQDPERLQLLVKDDGDPYFRMYMVRDGSLRNVVPEPAREGYDRPW